MPTELDNDLERIIAALTGPGMPFETESVERRGRTISRIFATSIRISSSWSTAVFA